MKQNAKQFSTKKSLLFSVIMCAFALVFIEFSSYLFVRFILKSNEDLSLSAPVEHHYHPFLAWESMPNMKVNTASPCGPQQAYIQTDEYGHAVTPYHYDHPDMVIAITGGSTMFGVGQSDNANTVPALLAKLIHDQLGINAEVINLAQRGYRSFQEMNALNNWISQGHKVDLVLSISGANDAIMGFAEPMNKNIFINERTWTGPVKLVRISEKSLPNPKVVSLRINREALAKKSYFIKAFYLLQQKLARKKVIQPQEKLSPSDNKSRPIPYNNIPVRINAAFNQYSAMQAIAKQNNAKFVMILQPTYFTKNHPQQHETYCTNTSLANTGGMGLQFGDYEKAFYASFRKKNKHFNYIDATMALNNIDSSLYIDNVHYTTEGANYLAGYIFNKIKNDVASIHHSNRLH